MTDLATLELGTSTVVLRRAEADDAHRFYRQLGFVASQEGMKLRL